MAEQTILAITGYFFGLCALLLSAVVVACVLGRLLGISVIPGRVVNPNHGLSGLLLIGNFLLFFIMRLIGGSVWTVLLLRGLGSRAGLSCYIDVDAGFGWATMAFGEQCVVLGYVDPLEALSSTEMLLRPVTLEDKVSICRGSYIIAGGRFERRSKLRPLSRIPVGFSVPKGATMIGVPARVE